MSTIGERIKTVRQVACMTQQEFSQTICVSQPFLSMVENGKERPSKITIRLISILFQIDESWLTTGKN